MKHWHAGSGLATRFGTLPLLCVLGLGSAAFLEGCSSAAPAEGDAQRGSVGVQLEVAPGINLETVTYFITGNGFDKTGSIDVSDAPVIEGTIGGIPAGAGYTLTLTATATDGATFTGSASFAVTAGGTATVTIQLKGSTPDKNGNVQVKGTFNVAPVIEELTVAPSTVYAGSSIALRAVAADPDAAPSSLTYYWSTTGGTIDAPLGPEARLSSDSPGTFTVKLHVSDGESTVTRSSTVSFLRRESDGGGGAGGGGNGGAGGRAPNVLFVIVDDLGAEGVSVYPELAGDSGQVPVPNLEALAENGVVFDNAWSSPACSPTRGTIISGQYGHRSGVTAVGNVLPTDTPTLFDRLTADSPDYAQAFFGKYHVGGGSIDPVPTGAFPAAPGILQHIRDLGITTFRGILGGGVANYFNWTTFDIDGPSLANTTYSTTALTDFAIDYIEQHEAEKPDEPWFIYQSYNAPHAANGGNNPYQVPPAELHSVDLSPVGNPAPGSFATNIPVYQANVQALDTELGRLFAAIDLENTVVIFVGDNGTPPPVKDTGTQLQGAKGSVYEGGVRAPVIIAGQGVTRRGRDNHLVVSTDYHATILELAGQRVSQIDNSYSLKPLLSDEAASTGRTHSFTEITQGTGTKRWTIKDTRYKLAWDNGTARLYDLLADPGETTNLYSNPAHSAARASLEAEIAALKTRAPAGYFP